MLSEPWYEAALVAVEVGVSGGFWLAAAARTLLALGLQYRFSRIKQN
jgi:hypothetical protein